MGFPPEATAICILALAISSIFVDTVNIWLCIPPRLLNAERHVHVFNKTTMRVVFQRKRLWLDRV